MTSIESAREYAKDQRQNNGITGKRFNKNIYK